MRAAGALRWLVAIRSRRGNTEVKNKTKVGATLAEGSLPMATWVSVTRSRLINIARSSRWEAKAATVNITASSKYQELLLDSTDKNVMRSRTRSRCVVTTFKAGRSHGESRMWELQREGRNSSPGRIWRKLGTRASKRRRQDQSNREI